MPVGAQRAGIGMPREHASRSGPGLRGKETTMVSSSKWLAGLFLVSLAGCGGGAGLKSASPGPGEVDVGYGNQPAGRVNTAVGTIAEADIAPGAPLRLEDLLRGKTAGLQIITRQDGKQALRIRGGNTSLMGNAEQEPLIVVDGVPVNGDDLSNALAGLVPADIRQVNVLKDAASTSIYGIRGAAGVIVITTRRR